MAAVKTNSAEKIIGYLVTGIADLGCLFILVIPGIDLIGLLIKTAGILSLNLYFLIRFGPSYIGGKNATQKLAVFFVSLFVNEAPIIDDLPTLTPQLWKTYSMMDKEAAQQAKASSSNDNTKQTRKVA